MNDQKQAAPLKVAVRIMSRGDSLTSFKIMVNGVFIGVADTNWLYNNDLIPFLDRLNPDEVQYGSKVWGADRDKIESDLAALRASRPENPEAVPKMRQAGDALWEAIKAILKEQTDIDPNHEISFDLAAIIEAAKTQWDTALAAAKKVGE